MKGASSSFELRFLSGRASERTRGQASSEPVRLAGDAAAAIDRGIPP
jgi:hypothetical protein